MLLFHIFILKSLCFCVLCVHTKAIKYNTKTEVRCAEKNIRRLAKKQFIDKISDDQIINTLISSKSYLVHLLISLLTKCNWYLSE